MELNSWKFEQGHGKAEVSMHGPRVMLIAVRGKCAAPFADQILETLEPLRAGARNGLQVFIDVEALQDYEAGFRDRFTEWFRANRSSFVAILALTRSAIVTMGVAIANVVLRNLVTTHRSRSTFEEALVAARKTSW